MVHALLAAHPSAASEMADADGLLPLHLACKHGAPVGVVQRLLEALPAACGAPTADGLLPLHLTLNLTLTLTLT